jgi:hypothetical protein
VAETSTPESHTGFQGDGGACRRQGRSKRRSQRKTKIMCEEHWTKRSRESGEFVTEKRLGKKFEGVRRER